MSTQQRIRRALDAIASVRQTLHRLKAAATDDAELQRALRGLRDAEEQLLSAMRHSQE